MAQNDLAKLIGKYAFDHTSWGEITDYQGLAEYLIANGVTIADKASAVAQWIPVTERLPEETGEYLVRRKSRPSEVTYPDVVRYYRNKTWCIFDSEWGYTEIYNVTHWMPLPELPKEE